MPDKTPSGGGFILLVEDDRGTRELEAQCLRPLNYELRCAATAEEAASVLRAATPELMLLDYSLPGTNAVELVKRLRGDGITVPPFLMVTGHGDERVAVEAMKCGALDYIIKNTDFLENLLPQTKKSLGRIALLKDLEAAQAELKRTSDQLSHVLGANPVLLFTMRGGAGWAETEWVSANGRELTGYSAEEILKPGWWQENIHPQDKAAATAGQKDLFRNGSLTQDFRFRKKNGTYFWVHAQFKLSPAGMGEIIGSWTDITQVKESEARFKAMLDSSPDGFIVRRGLEMIYVNASGLKMLGARDESALLGRDVLTLLPEALRADFRRRLEEIDTLGVTTPPAEARLPRPDGSIADIEISGSPIIFSGEKCGMVFFRDISERKKTERLMQEIASLQRVESLGALAGGIAHDFNNMLTGIMANLSLLRERAGGAENSEIIRDTLEAARNAQALTTQLLAFSKGGKPVRTEFRFGKALEEIFSLATRGTKAAHELAVPAGVWSVEGDAGQLKQAVNNLLVNALQAMPDGGMLRLEAGNVRLAADGPLPAGNYVKVQVSDTGTGIPEEYLLRIFEPYFTTKSYGHGLGLSMTWSVIKNHGGHIVARSVPGKGSTFEILLPSTGRAMESEAGEETKIRKGSGRILLLEDDELVKKAAVRMLTELGYTCEITSEGSETLRRYAAEKAAGRPFAAVILDLTIPGGMGGKEAGRELRRMDPGARIVVSSGYSDEAVMADYRAFGFDAVLPKPYKYEDLAATLTQLLDHAQEKVGGE